MKNYHIILREHHLFLVKHKYTLLLLIFLLGAETLALNTSHIENVQIGNSVLEVILFGIRTARLLHNILDILRNG